jgi:ATP synthase F1 complex assembly factor 2
MQTEYIRPTTMPLMTLARNAIDIEADERIREFMEKSVLSYLERDTVLFREDPSSKLYKIQ